MQSNLLSLTYEIEIQPGEKLTLPQALIDGVGAGRWMITIQPSGLSTANPAIHDHTAFLNSYTTDDEGLYDEYSAG